MTKYCLFSCVLACLALLALGVSCDHVGRAFKTDVGDDSVTPDRDAGGETGAGERSGANTRAAGEEPQRDVDEAAGQVVFKPVAGEPAIAGAAERKDVEPPQSVQARAVELAAKELAVNLRLLEEDDPNKRAGLEREMVSLREQRRSLYQTRVEGK